MDNLSYRDVSRNVFVTIKRKSGYHKSIPIWNRVAMSLQGDMSDLNNVICELKELKIEIANDMNHKGFALKDLVVTIEQLNR